MDEESEKDFRITCRKFLIKACEELKNRCDFNDTRLLNRIYFYPNNAFDIRFHESSRYERSCGSL